MESGIGELVGALGPPVDGVSKIVVLRASGIGDFLFSLPALHSLRSAYPEAEIVLVGSAWHAAALEARPGPVDRVVVGPPVDPATAADSTAGLADREMFFERMREERFDLGVQLHGGGRHSNPYISAMGTGVTIGHRTPDAEPLDRWLPYYHFQHEVLRCLEAVALAGAVPVSLSPTWDVTRAERERIAPLLALVPWPFVVLNPGAGDARRRWPVSKFAQVGDALSEAGAGVAIAGDVGDSELAHGVAGTMRHPALDLSGRLSLGELGALFSEASLVIANDSGPLHLARAVGTPTVGLYWCGNLINAGPLTNATHRVALSWRLACPVCGSDCMLDGCSHSASFIADISVDEVLDAALDLWERYGASAKTEAG